jgi:flagellar protein FliS
MRKNPLDNYRKTQIHTADPVVLVRLLLEEAIRSVRQAGQESRAGHVMERGTATTKSVELLTELMLNLNREESPDLAGKLSTLYEYCQHRLLAAHVAGSGEAYEEVLGILSNIHESWVAVMGRIGRGCASQGSDACASEETQSSAWI